MRGVARFALRSPVSTRFLVAALSQPAALIQSLATDITFGGRDLRAGLRTLRFGGCGGALLPPARCSPVLLSAMARSRRIRF